MLLASKAIIFIVLLIIFFYIFKTTLLPKFWSRVLVFIAVVTTTIMLGYHTAHKRVIEEKSTNFQEIFQKETFGQVYLWTGTSIRLFQLRILFEQVKEDKILFCGYGLYASKRAIVGKHLQYNLYPGFFGYNYHNQYAQILAELGIFGLLIILLILILSWIKAIKNKDDFFMAFLAIISVIFLTESILWRQIGLFLFIIFIVILNCLETKKN